MVNVLIDIDIDIETTGATRRHAEVSTIPCRRRSKYCLVRLRVLRSCHSSH